MADGANSCVAVHGIVKRPLHDRQHDTEPPIVGQVPPMSRRGGGPCTARHTATYQISAVVERACGFANRTAPPGESRPAAAQAEIELYEDARTFSPRRTPNRSANALRIDNDDNRRVRRPTTLTPVVAIEARTGAGNHVSAPSCAFRRGPIATIARAVGGARLVCGMSSRTGNGDIGTGSLIAQGERWISVSNQLTTTLTVAGGFEISRVASAYRSKATPSRYGRRGCRHSGGQMIRRPIIPRWLLRYLAPISW